jgi:hypothetical protein
MALCYGLVMGFFQKLSDDGKGLWKPVVLVVVAAVFGLAFLVTIIINVAQYLMK